MSIWSETGLQSIKSTSPFYNYLEKLNEDDAKIKPSQLLIFDDEFIYTNTEGN
jgi:hypothetical protein